MNSINLFPTLSCPCSFVCFIYACWWSASDVFLIFFMLISIKMNDWTCQDVFKWLQTEFNLPEEQAQKFVTEEIDGAALQCLTTDNLTGPKLQLKLGVAARIFQRVKEASGQTLLLFALNRSPWYDDAARMYAQRHHVHVCEYTSVHSRQHVHVHMSMITPTRQCT
jgi:hypothetical protein